MAESKGSQGATGQVEPTASDTMGPRSGWRRWRPYSAAIVAVAAIFAASAVIGAHVRAGKSTDIKPPNGVPSAAPLSIPVNPGVPVTVTVYMDMRSAQSKAFAESYASTFDKLLNSGQARIDYRLVTQTDARLGGKGSAMAANAVACAQDQGRDQFEAYVKQLWKHQPAQDHDKFASAGYLEKLAEKVPGLPKTEKLQASEFVPCVNSDDHGGWVIASQKDFQKAGLGDVPVLRINGQTVSVAKDGLTPAKLTALVEKAAAQAAGQSPSASASSSASAPSPAPSASASASATATPSAG
ncbi:DsbA family protein [Streptantibioticus ferralitis]|uniref:Thioredoxin domain-containing protein n=1 Tax=Streptantibioticus ferralitis TaxID=236510 RepID=A0ABT5Z4G9_9ACTN|nr:thioredoxin domain-containing protein [Streptantibioticus ferralitis]MDF2258726.1 thioredoxin domain-containing protein [Streptantibioticus ferralitis]